MLEVTRNSDTGSLSARRAWIEMGFGSFPYLTNYQSLSARRAWIEIHSWWLRCWQLAVALRKESVDRNVQLALKMMKNTESLSARRAWIEIIIQYAFIGVLSRSLSARRAWIEI